MRRRKSGRAGGGQGLYEHIHDLVRQIPAGRVATYGQIAAAVDRCTPRMAGYAMAAVPAGSDVPWHRVINGRGMVSPRVRGGDHDLQRKLLEAEGVVFDGRGRVDLEGIRWTGL